MQQRRLPTAFTLRTVTKAAGTACLDAPGLAGALSGQTKLEGSGRYDVRRYVRGTWRSKDGSVQLRDRWTRWSPADASQPRPPRQAGPP